MRAYAALLLLLSALPGLAAEDPADVGVCLDDRAWPERSAAYLSSQHSLTTQDWPVLSPERQKKVCTEWARQRQSALQSQRIVLAQGRPATEAQARHIRLLADTGLLNKSELSRLAGLRSQSGAALLDASSIRPSGALEAQRSAAGAAFKEARLDAGAPAVHGKDAAAPADPDAAYRTSRQMALDPAGFALSRPELLGAPAQSELAERARLRQRLGKVFEAADRMRAQRKLEFRFASDTAMAGSFSDQIVEQGRTIVRLNAALRDADPALLATAVVYELSGADGLRSEQAFGSGYATVLENAFRARLNRSSILLFGSHKKMQELFAEPDPAAREGGIKALSLAVTRR